MTIAKDALPTPSTVDLEQLTARQQSSAWRSGGILRTRDADPQNRPRRWTLTYQLANGATLAAVRQHFQQHNLTDFDWTPAAGAAAARVIHREPPTLDWDSSTTGTARVFLEEVLAHD